METAVVKYNKDVAIIKALDEKYKGITIRPGNEDDYAIVKGGLKEYRNHEIEVEKWHKVGKADALKIGRDYDAERTKWLVLISPGKNELKATRKTEDDRIKEIETKRVRDIRTMINDIRNLDYSLPDLNLTEMKELKAEVEGSPVTEDDYQEFVGEAMAAVHNVLIAINNAIENREQLDKVQAERKTEEARLDKIRVEQEAAQVKIDEAERKTAEAQANLDKAAREIQKEKGKLEAAKQAEIDRKEREEFEAQAKVQAELDAKKKLEQEAIAASERADVAEAEKKRQLALIPDRDKLLSFADELDAIKGPVINDVAMSSIMDDSIKFLQNLSTDIRKQVNEL